jgi:hypothetical protein
MNNTTSTTQENYDYAMAAMIQAVVDGKVTFREFCLVATSLEAMLKGAQA